MSPWFIITYSSPTHRIDANILTCQTSTHRKPTLRRLGCPAVDLKVADPQVRFPGAVSAKGRHGTSRDIINWWDSGSRTKKMGPWRNVPWDFFVRNPKNMMFVLFFFLKGGTVGKFRMVGRKKWTKFSGGVRLPDSCGAWQLWCFSNIILFVTVALLPI